MPHLIPVTELQQRLDQIRPVDLRLATEQGDRLLQRFLAAAVQHEPASLEISSTAQQAIAVGLAVDHIQAVGVFPPIRTRHVPQWLNSARIFVSADTSRDLNGPRMNLAGTDVPAGLFVPQPD